MRICGLVLACVVIAAPSAWAASPSVCPTVLDPRGDAGGYSSAQVYDETGDLLGVAVGSDGKQLRVAVSLAKVDRSGLSKGHFYDVYLDDGEGGRILTAFIDGVTHRFRAYTGRAPRQGATVGGGEDLGAIAGAVDLARKEVQMTLPLTQLRWKRGHRAQVSAGAFRSVSSDGGPGPTLGSLGSSSDFTDGSAPYAYGDRGCR